MTQTVALHDAHVLAYERVRCLAAECSHRGGGIDYAAGMQRVAYARLDPLGDQRPVSSDELRVDLAHAALVAPRLGIGLGELTEEQARELADVAVAEAVRLVERDAMRRAERANGDGAAGHEQQRERFIFVSDVELEQLPPPAWLLDGVLLTETVAQMIGAPGTMKSFLALDLGAHVRLCKPWAGRTVVGGPVVYVLAEGKRSFGLRLRAWRLHHHHDGPIGLHFLTLPVQLADRAEVAELLAAIERLGEVPRLIVIDTQARCSVGLDENSNTDMGRLIAGAERIQRETAGTVVLLHHPPRDGDRERGAGAQRGGVDTTLLVSLDGDYLSVRVDRQKDGEDGEVLHFRRRVVEVDETGRTSCVLVPVTEQETQRAPLGPGDLSRSVRVLLDALRTAPDGVATSATLHKVTGLRDRTFFDALAKAKKWDLIDGAARGYRITPTGRGLLA